MLREKKIEITNDDLNKIIKIAKGSFRDAVKNLEQYSNDKSFLIKDLNINLEVFVEALIKKDIKIILADLKKQIIFII